MTKGGRMVWIRCSGVPVDVWDDNYFKTLSYPFGSFVCVDSGTRTMSRLEFARILLRTTLLQPISCVRQVKINGLVVNVRFIEELGGEITKQCICKQSQRPSSIDTDSSDSTDFLSEEDMNFGEENDYEGSGNEDERGVEETRESPQAQFSAPAKEVVAGRCVDGTISADGGLDEAGGGGVEGN